MKPIKQLIRPFVGRTIGQLIKILLRGLFKVFYRIRVTGIENHAAAGKRVLVVANHVSFLDGVLLWLYLPGDPGFAINSQIARLWWVRPASWFVPLLAVESDQPLAVRALIARVRQGKNTIIFPEGRITMTGGLMKVYEGPGVMADRVGAALLPVFIEGAQYTHFSRMQCQLRLRWFPRITITILPARKLDVPKNVTGAERHRQLGERLLDLMVDMKFLAGDTGRTLYEALLDARHIHGSNHIVAEDVRREPMSYRQLILRAHILGRRMARELKKETHAGLLLPTSSAAAVAFFGLHLYGKIPVMLNFSTGIRGMLSAIKTAEVGAVYTSRRFVEEAKLTDEVARLAEQARIYYLEDLVQGIGPADKLRGIITAAFPRIAYQWLSGKPGPHDPAVVLFTSGSEGAPKGVVLSHANLLSNITQLKSRGDLRPTDVVLNVLPVFHSFGFTLGTMLPILSGMKVFFYPSPLHYRLIPEIAYQTNATILFGTNTFLAGYARHAHPYDFYSLRYIFSGGEKLQSDTRQIWMEKLGARIFEGYGVTETAPVLSFNTPLENRLGSVGRFLPGVEHHIEPMEGVEDGGRLWVRGPNVMLGYLLPDAPGKLRPLEGPLGHGWHDTGDVVHLDEDGYLWIKGRAKRFAKVGSEMVSLTAMEEFVHHFWPNFSHAVVATAHPLKGERLTLVTECPDLNRQGLLQRAKEEGMGEIGIPKKIIPVEGIPLLGTGKINYAEVEKIAREA